MTHILVLAALMAVSGQNFDFSSLDKLAKKAKESNVITLEGNQLKTASQFLSMGGDEDSKKVQSLVDKLKGVYVRNYEFSEEGQYKDSDLNEVRDQLHGQGWSRIIESREAKEHDEIYIRSGNQEMRGIAIVSAEPKEVTVVVIQGPIDLQNLGELSGTLGIPNLQQKHRGSQSPAKK